MNTAGQDNIQADQESLRVQLSELNNRARWYSSQLWQIPFLYIGAGGGLISAIHEGTLKEWFIVCLILAVSGYFIIQHMKGLSNGEERAVLNLQRIERTLGLNVTSEYRKNYTKPLHTLVILIFLSSALTSLFLLTLIDS